MAEIMRFLLLLQASAVGFLASGAVFEYNVHSISQARGEARAATDNDCYRGDGADYRGSRAVTASGKVCQPWTSSATINPWNHGGKGLGEHNFCRNPDSDTKPWCWVNDLGTKFEYCDVPECSSARATPTPTPTSAQEALASLILGSGDGPTAAAAGGEGDCYEGDGSSYRGSVSVTESGTPCLSWSGSSSINAVTHRNKGLGTHNHCRNPDGDRQPWCWVSHSRVKFGFCNIPKCSSSPSPASATPSPTTQETGVTTTCYEGDGSNYRGNVSNTETDTPCLKWTNSRHINPSNHPGKGLGNHNACRNPDGDARPWCWVDHTRRKFGYCTVPECSPSSSSTASPTTAPSATSSTSGDGGTDSSVTDCYRGDGSTYRGFANTSQGGLRCLSWSSSSRINPWTHPDTGLGDHNFCRNPDQDSKPWCWVSSTKFAYCEVPRCAPVAPGPQPAGNGSSTCGSRPMEQALSQVRLRRFVGTPAATNATSKIIGGNIPMYGMYPWQASVRVISRVYSDGRVSAKHSCGGTIIGEYWILTAAHCFSGMASSRLIVYVGDHNLYRKESSEQRFRVEELINHRLYSRVTHDNDIALLKLKPIGGKGIQFDEHVQPACLPTENTPYLERKMCLISGWGKTETSSPSMLRAAEVPLVSDSQCRRLHRRLSPRMVCAGLMAGGVDTCSGDSGGPLVCQQDGAYTVMGITSWGVDCGAPRSPGVYAKVSKFVTWINHNMNKYA